MKQKLNFGTKKRNFRNRARIGKRWGRNIELSNNVGVDNQNCIDSASLAEVTVNQADLFTTEEDNNDGGYVDVIIINDQNSTDCIDSNNNNATNSIEIDDSDILTEELNVPNSSNMKLEGNRIVNIDFFFQSLVTISEHSNAFGCALKNLKIIGEKKMGLAAKLYFRCNMCNMKLNVSTQNNNDSKSLDNLNYQSILGGVSTGIGYSQTEEFFGVLNIPYMSSRTYQNVQKRVQEDIKKISDADMFEAAMEAKQIAIEQGDVAEDGVPLITVQADGCYSKRTYGVGSNYSSLSGVGTIVAHSTKKVIWSTVRNKYCCICQNAKNQNTVVKEHDCNQNYCGPSTCIETSAIVEGFCKSEQLYGIRYNKVIADGDASVYANILKARPYASTHIEKIECRNHLMRVFRKHARELAANTKFHPSIRKLFTNGLLRCCVGVRSAIKYRKVQNTSTAEKIKYLANDIKNVPYHVYGKHADCATYFCDQQKSEVSETFKKFEKSGMITNITDLFKRLKYNSSSLIYDVESNAVEQFHSIICKTVGGKRINFSRGQSYTSRAKFAVLQHNTKSAHYWYEKCLLKRSPKKRIISIERKRKGFAKKRLDKDSMRKKHRTASRGEDAHYGNETCERPDMTEAELLESKQNVILKLKCERDDRHNIQIKTIDQSQSTLWHEMRLKRLSSSNFGVVCRSRNEQSFPNKVKQILYNSESASFAKAVVWGRDHEEDAIAAFEQETQFKVEKCGLFIYDKYPCLSASPDGIIDTDAVVEAKCPYNSRELHPLDAIKLKKIKYVKYDSENDTFVINKAHPYYYQMQGQMEITKRKICFFVIWSLKGMIFLKIPHDADFFEKEMLPILLKFYFNSLLLEIVDSRYKRGMMLRDYPQCADNNFDSIFD